MVTQVGEVGQAGCQVHAVDAALIQENNGLLGSEMGHIFEGRNRRADQGGDGLGERVKGAQSPKYCG